MAFSMAITDFACKGKRLFEQCNEFRKTAPQLSEFFDNLAARKISVSQYCYNFLGYILVSVVILEEAAQRTFKAEKILNKLQTNQAKENIENKIKEILEILEDIHCEAKRDTTNTNSITDFQTIQQKFPIPNSKFQTNPDDIKEKSFPPVEKNIRSLFNELKTEQGKLYDDIMDQIISIIEKKENARFLQGLGELAIVVGLGTGLAVKNLDFSALTTKDVICVGVGVAACLGLVAWKKCNDDLTNNNEETIAGLRAARRQVLEANIIVETFLTELELLEIKGGYSENDLN